MDSGTVSDFSTVLLTVTIAVMKLIRGRPAVFTFAAENLEVYLSLRQPPVAAITPAGVISLARPNREEPRTAPANLPLR
jgi:hypothetical protein